jgi:CHASE2 domain-containing sensor protein
MRNSVAGGVLTALCGLMLWNTPIGQWWSNASYDYSFRFATRAVTNKVCLVMMDNEAYGQFQQTRSQPWDRGLHARLLNKLSDDGCALAVIDSFFGEAHDASKDEALANAMRRQRHIVLMAKQSAITTPTIAGVHPLYPAEPFYSVAGTNWGVAWLDPDIDMVVRRHWPFPSPGPYPSLPEAAARLVNPQAIQIPQPRWLRYYGQDGQWTRLSYGAALNQSPNFFRDQIVFIGTHPETSILDGEKDEFCTPYARWTGETTGGVDIVLTEFLNLVNHDWLRRPPGWVEIMVLVIAGVGLGGSLGQLRPLSASLCAALVAVGVLVGGVSCSYFTNYWVPWLIIAAGQIPVALGWAFLIQLAIRPSESPVRAYGAQGSPASHPAPEIPGYKLHLAPFGKGAYGEVWLARNPDGKWRAVKVIYLANFNNDPAPYEREFKGVSRYQPVSDRHPGLLRVDFVSEKLEGHFYYVMELGDSLKPGWESDPSTYKPHDLASERAGAEGRRLPLGKCVEIGLAVSDAMDFLHRQGLTHRDIKPQNIIFVNGRPKMADLGLIAEIRPPDQERTNVGTPGYMPPAPELPGTPQADIYALGIMLYVLSTGRDTAFFPEIATTLMGSKSEGDFLALNAVVLKACQPDLSLRYSTALEMHRALQEVQRAIDQETAAAPH